MNEVASEQELSLVNVDSAVGARIIVALDFASASEAKALVERLDPTLCRLKIGKQLFTAAGPALVTEFQQAGFDIFLDLKFHDIPNTIAGACQSAVDLGVWMMNVHASGGARMLEAARRAVPEDSDTLLIAVTVLTSMTAEDLSGAGVNRPLDQHVRYLATLTQDAGLDGVVCSPMESSSLRELCGKGFNLVTPGVRPAGSEASDQRRVMTPADAIRAGSDYLVIGRPVSEAKDPFSALQKLSEQLS